MIECPNHAGSFDCTPFCNTCYGEQAYDPNAMEACIVPNCKEQLVKATWVEELGFCVEHSNAYFSQELDPFTLERIA